MRKNIFTIQFAALLFTVILAGCSSTGESPQSGGSSGSSSRSIEITDIRPLTLPSVTRDSFHVTVKGHDLYQGVYVHLEINSHANSSCNAFADSSLFITSASSSGTITVRTDSLHSSCVSQNSVFRIAVWFRDTLNIIRRDSAYYQWGNAPNTGNTLTADIEPWRMNYVSDALADTMNKCIGRSLNPADSNFIKCTVNFDNTIHTSSDTNFMVGANNSELLTNICDWWSQNHSISTFHNKVIYARFNNVNLGLVGWSKTGNYPVNGSDNWSYIFYKNIDSICSPNGTRNDTTEGNLTAIHEIMHQIGNIHGSRAHLYHYGYFANKCALWDDESHFTTELQNHRYTNMFRICINHTMELRSFRQVMPLDNTGGNVIYTQFIAPNPNLKAAGKTNDDKYTITMSLPKQEYRKYEPVMAKITLVNHDTKPLDIYNIHDVVSNEPQFTIKKKSGNIYDSRSMVGFFLSFYSTEILPGDSLAFSMIMNDWGEPVSYQYTKKLDEVFFSQFGYFPAGEYTAYFHCSTLGDREEVYSNEVPFKVTEATQEDMEVLKLFKDGNYDEALSKYPNSPYAEHVLRWKMLTYWNAITDNTLSDYNIFIQKYPKSMYLYDWGFMLPYIKSAEQRQDSFEGGIDYLLSLQSEESLARQSLSNSAFTTIINNYGKVFEKNK